jgi:hypothetical protein
LYHRLRDSAVDTQRVETVGTTRFGPLMAAFFLVVLFVGLGLGSVVMWRGVERYDSSAPTADSYGRELPAQFVILVVPAAAGALLSFGVVGYQVFQHSTLGPVASIGIATAAATVGAIAAVMLVARWAVPSARRSPEDPRFSLQGYPGRVLAGIDAADLGEISYEANGQSVRIRARSVDGTMIPAGVDIAIERLEESVAYVELWSEVEERL